MVLIEQSDLEKKVLNTEHQKAWDDIGAEAFFANASTFEESVRTFGKYIVHYCSLNMFASALGGAELSLPTISQFHEIQGRCIESWRKACVESIQIVRESRRGTEGLEEGLKAQDRLFGLVYIVNDVLFKLCDVAKKLRGEKPSTPAHSLPQDHDQTFRMMWIVPLAQTLSTVHFADTAFMFNCVKGLGQWKSWGSFRFGSPQSEESEIVEDQCLKLFRSSLTGVDSHLTSRAETLVSTVQRLIIRPEEPPRFEEPGSVKEADQITKIADQLQDLEQTQLAREREIQKYNLERELGSATRNKKQMLLKLLCQGHKKLSEKLLEAHGLLQDLSREQMERLADAARIIAETKPQPLLEEEQEQEQEPEEQEQDPEEVEQEVQVAE
eukprot:GHVN01055679.1.p3 GENE.GHVN01055679.1~~GHVN01055679.1.p3  ORF type:complete len:383 (+),score=47.05 GHVN01055679.1:3252-4400(+)